MKRIGSLFAGHYSPYPKRGQRCLRPFQDTAYFYYSRSEEASRVAREMFSPGANA